MNIQKLIGMRVLNKNTHEIGTIKYIQNGIVAIDFYGSIIKYAYPSAFSGILELEDEEVQETVNEQGMIASFERFKNEYKNAINEEIQFLKSTGGKRYKIIDGERLPSKNDEYLYAFDTDTDLHFPDGTAIKLWFPDNIVTAYVVSCEDFSILIRTMEYIGDTVNSVEFTSEQWQLLEALMERLDEMHPDEGALAYEVACNGKSRISKMQNIMCGQNLAFNRATSEKVTFIWGPPGTGKTETLANIALEHIYNGKRVLMLSYSNVSVDGALLRVARKADLADGMVIRYGYPRTKELLDNKKYTSYQVVLQKNKQLAKEYQELIEQKKKLKKKDPARVVVNKKINKIRDHLLNEEKILIQNAAFVATTVSKATVDPSVYMQKFDVVIFDEASMAYVPQIVFAAGLARKHFVCLGDFCQLPAIVQNKTDDRLIRDIFEYTGITSAVDAECGHEWLVMLDLQYRMHHSIADFVSQHMYHGRLRTSDRIYENRKEIARCSPCPESAMSLVNVSDMYSVCTKTKDGSRINIMSAFFSLRLAEKALEHYEVGIITPYSAQSRLLLAMIRDLQEMDERWTKVSSATVHQFQGSEKPIIIYDAVDCFRMPYPGMLLTSLKNDTANRLFNVAITRAKGKFILVGNIDYLKRKNISRNLIFTKAINNMLPGKQNQKGSAVIQELIPRKEEEPRVYIEERERSWDKFLEDIMAAKNSIHIDIPDVIDDNEKAINDLIQTLQKKESEGVNICIRLSEDIDIPKGLQVYTQNYGYVTNPITIIDKKLIWFGHPIYAADFISEGDILDTEYFPCIRFAGNYTARSIQAFLEI